MSCPHCGGLLEHAAPAVDQAAALEATLEHEAALEDERTERAADDNDTAEAIAKIHAEAATEQTRIVAEAETEQAQIMADAIVDATVIEADTAVDQGAGLEDDAPAADELEDEQDEQDTATVVTVPAQAQDDAPADDDGKPAPRSSSPRRGLRRGRR